MNYSDATPIGPPATPFRPPNAGYAISAQPGFPQRYRMGPPQPQAPQRGGMLPPPPPTNFGGGPMNGFPALSPQQIEQLKELLQAQGVQVGGASSSNGSRSLMGKTGAALTAANLVEPRVSHLEEKMKEALDRLSSLAIEQDSPKLGFVMGRVLLDTVEYVSSDSNASAAVAECEPTPVGKDTKVSLSYPQAEVVIDGETKIVMRRRTVDADTAQIQFSWIVVYLNDAADESCDVAFVDLKELDRASVSLIFSSPPYNIGKKYEKRAELQDYLSGQRRIILELCACLAPGGAICWQTGNFVNEGTISPLDLETQSFFEEGGLHLRKRFIGVFMKTPIRTKTKTPLTLD